MELEEGSGAMGWPLTEIEGKQRLTLVRRMRGLVDRIWEDPKVDEGGCRWRRLEGTKVLEFRVRGYL